MTAKKSTKKSDAMVKHLRALGLAKYPGAHLKSPWPGHLDLAVNDKTFAYLSAEGEPLGVSCKLPHSNGIALMLPNTKPTGYGLGKSGWVSASFDDDDDLPPAEIFEAWIDESYRAQAPKRLIAQLDAASAMPARGAATAKSAGTAKRAAKKTASVKGAADTPAKPAATAAAAEGTATTRAATASARKTATKKAATGGAATRGAATRGAAAGSSAATRGAAAGSSAAGNNANTPAAKTPAAKTPAAKKRARPAAKKTAKART